ncbi:hypothetical protein [Clostridium thailandense]|nr:hypothetical protein [Clostridium thailandense]
MNIDCDIFEYSKNIINNLDDYYKKERVMGIQIECSYKDELEFV